MTGPVKTKNRIDHIAVPVRNIKAAVDWYTSIFDCTVEYQDDTWAFLIFDNIKLALVVPDQHPPHIAFVRDDAEKYGKMKTQRDGTKSTYIRDPSGNCVEIVAQA